MSQTSAMPARSPFIRPPRLTRNCRRRSNCRPASPRDMCGLRSASSILTTLLPISIRRLLLRSSRRRAQRRGHAAQSPMRPSGQSHCGGLCIGNDVVIVKRPAEGCVRGYFGVAKTQVGISRIVAQPVFARATLYLRDALAAKPLIGKERGRRALRAGARKDRRKRHAVLDRLVGALSEVRQHRVRGIAKKGQSSLGPCRQWFAIIKRPTERHLHLREKILDARVPARKLMPQD